MNPASKRQITIEDLLRLKRAERPPAEFWDGFDRELRAKQLAALLEKRPWWRNLHLPQALASLSRYHLSLGATAVLAVTYFATRDYPENLAPTTTADAVASSQPAAELIPAVATATAPAVSVRGEPTNLVASEDDLGSATNAVASTTMPEPAASMVTDVFGTRSDTPSARYIAENLRAAQAAETVVARGLLTRAHGFELRGLPAKPAVEPLAQMTSPSSARTSKLSTAMVASFTPDRYTRPSDRVAHRLANDSDDRLYETASRLSARGDRLGLRF